MWWSGRESERVWKEMQGGRERNGGGPEKVRGRERDRTYLHLVTTFAIYKTYWGLNLLPLIYFALATLELE